MSTRGKPKIDMMIVLGTDHAGLKPSFQRLEDEMRRAIARFEDTRLIESYLRVMTNASKSWFLRYEAIESER